MYWEQRLNHLGAKHVPCFFAINYKGDEGVVVQLTDLTQQNIQISFPFFTNALPYKKEDNTIHLYPQHIDKAIYTQAFNTVQEHLLRGDIHLLNLTFATPLAMDTSLLAIFHHAKAKYKIFFQDKWVCFSPEPFIQIHDHHIHTFPMKGTLDATLPDATHILQNDPKEKEEHQRSVALLKEDLSLIADDIIVERLMYTEEIITQKGKIIQMSSEIKGSLPEKWYASLGTMLKKILPAGSIAGVPKEKSLSIIATTENYARGYYTGVAGIFDGHNVDSCVLIRFIEKNEGKYIYKSGGGITAKSQLDKEYAELQQKIYVPIS